MESLTEKGRRPSRDGFQQELDRVIALQRNICPSASVVPGRQTNLVSFPGHGFDSADGASCPSNGFSANSYFLSEMSLLGQGQGMVGHGMVGHGMVGQGMVGQGMVGQGVVGQSMVGQSMVGHDMEGQDMFPVLLPPPLPTPDEEADVIFHQTADRDISPPPGYSDAAQGSELQQLERIPSSSSHLDCMYLNLFF